MKKRGILIGVCILGLLLIPAAGLTLAEDPGPRRLLAPQAEMGTAFTYQGKLEDGGSLVNGNCDFEFSLYDASGDGTQIGSTQTETNVGVSDGLFTVQLDFGTGAFNGEARWLEIGVRCPTGVGSYTTLTQRQELTPAPYALALPGLWTQQNATSPNLIGGYHGNSVSGGVEGATIGGGGASAAPNQVGGDYATVGGGYDNTASSWYATVGGGRNNDASGDSATVGGGQYNTASSWAFVGGGYENQAGGQATVGGGYSNDASGGYATVGGGYNNTASGSSATVGGGHSNVVTATYAIAAGGIATALLGRPLRLPAEMTTMQAATMPSSAGAKRTLPAGGPPPSVGVGATAPAAARLPSLAATTTAPVATTVSPLGTMPRHSTMGPLSGGALMRSHSRGATTPSRPAPTVGRGSTPPPAPTRGFSSRAAAIPGALSPTATPRRTLQPLTPTGC